MSVERIPIMDLADEYHSQEREINEAIHRVLRSGWYILGAEVEAFEKEFAAYHGVSDAVGVGSGTDAIEISLRTLGIGRGDLVYTVSHTAVATVAAIELTGATPVFVDIDEHTFTMSPRSLRKAIEKNHDGVPRAVIPVHLYGHPADMPAILELANANKLHVIEDCAQAHGASIEGRKAGTWGDAGTFSFYPTKNLGVPGDGGAVITNNPSYAKELRLYRQYGWREKYLSERQGMNTRLDELHAAVLRVKLPRLDRLNSLRKKLADQYRIRLKDTAIICPQERGNIVHAYHQFVIRTVNRDALKEHLGIQNVETMIHYPAPVHLQPAYRGRLPGCDDLPVTEKIAGKILSLPIVPQLTLKQVDRVCDVMLEWLQHR